MSFGDYFRNDKNHYHLRKLAHFYSTQFPLTCKFEELTMLRQIEAHASNLRQLLLLVRTQNTLLVKLISMRVPNHGIFSL